MAKVSFFVHHLCAYKKFDYESIAIFFDLRLKVRQGVGRNVNKRGMLPTLFGNPKKKIKTDDFECPEN